jgi:thioredoxin 1
MKETSMAAATIELTADNFQETALDNDGLVLVDFWAEWCGPCRSFAPVFERVAERHPDAVFGKVDTEAEQELASAFQIMSIPTLMVFRDRVLLYSQPGALPENALEDLVEQAKGLDMEDVRKQIAEHEASHSEA